MSEEELLLGHVLFAPMGLNKDCLSHGVSSDGPGAQPTYYFGPVPIDIFVFEIYGIVSGKSLFDISKRHKTLGMLNGGFRKNL